MERTLKDPDATIQRGFDWSDYLAVGEILTASQWILPTGLTLIDQSRDGAFTFITLSGGAVGEKYIITNRVTTSEGLVDDRSIVVQVVDR